MAMRFYIVIRDLHLYAGLFLSPFLPAYAISNGGNHYADYLPSASTTAIHRFLPVC